MLIQIYVSALRKYGIANAITNPVEVRFAGEDRIHNGAFSLDEIDVDGCFCTGDDSCEWDGCWGRRN